MCLQIFVKKSHLRIASDKCQNLPVIEVAQQHFYRSHHSSRQTLPIGSCGCSTLLFGRLSEYQLQITQSYVTQDSTAPSGLQGQ